jgi:hypothetical protein
MKALTLTQPWASLVALGQKSIETRSWFTSYRGELLIHAAKGFPKWAQDFCYEDPFRGFLPPTAQELPLGVILCKVELLACVRTNQLHKLGEAGLAKPDVIELAFGDYSEGRYAWALRLIETFNKPIPAKGSLGLWEFELPRTKRSRSKCTCAPTTQPDFHEPGCPEAPAVCDLCGKPYTHKPQDCPTVRNK